MYNPKGQTIEQIASTPEGVAWLETVDFQRPCSGPDGLCYLGADGFTLPCSGKVIDMATGEELQ